MLTQFPVIGERIQVSSLEGNGVALAIGIVGSLWAGFGVVLATEHALDQGVRAVPLHHGPPFSPRACERLSCWSCSAQLTVVSTVASGLVGGGADLLGPVGGIVISVGINLLVFRHGGEALGTRQASFSKLLPGVVLAAVCWSGLQLLGGWFISHEVRNAAPAYGTFALVLGLLVWINLGAMLTVLSAELNVVWERELWPRSLLGAGRDEDERVMRAIAKAQAREDSQRIRVDFERR